MESYFDSIIFRLIFNFSVMMKIPYVYNSDKSTSDNTARNKVEFLVDSVRMD